MSATNCCVTHDATLSQDSACATLSKMYVSGAQIVTGGQPVPWGGQISFARFAPTQALNALAAQRPVPTRQADGTTAVPTVLKVSTLKLCKQHATGQCKLGAMCRNVHICRQAESGNKPARCESASRTGLRLPPIAPVLATSVPSLNTNGVRQSSTVPVLPQINAHQTGAPQRSCTSPIKSARSARLTGVDASQFRPTQPATSRLSTPGVDMEDVVLVSTPLPTPPPRSPCPQAPGQTSTGSGCFKRFAKRWNEPLKNGSGALVSTTVSGTVQASTGNSIDLETVQANVNVLALAQGEADGGNSSLPMPPANASGEGRCYARRSAFDAKDGCFAVFTN